MQTNVKHMRALSLIKTSNSNSSSSFKLIISQNPPKLAFASDGPTCRDIIQPLSLTIKKLSLYSVYIIVSFYCLGDLMDLNIRDLKKTKKI